MAKDITPKVQTGFSAYQDADLFILANHVADDMLLNALLFTTPPISIVNFRAQNTAFGNAIEAALSRSTQSIIDRNALRPGMLTSMTNMALYVNSVGLGDATKLQKSGFPLMKTPVNNTEVGQVQNMREAGVQAKGGMKLRWNTVIGARAYNVQITTNIELENSWQTAMVVNGSRCTITGLQNKTTYWVRVAAVGKESLGQGPWSAPLEVLVA